MSNQGFLVAMLGFAVASSGCGDSDGGTSTTSQGGQQSVGGDGGSGGEGGADDGGAGGGGAMGGAGNAGGNGGSGAATTSNVLILAKGESSAMSMEQAAIDHESRFAGLAGMPGAPIRHVAAIDIATLPQPKAPPAPLSLLFVERWASLSDAQAFFALPATQSIFGQPAVLRAWTDTEFHSWGGTAAVDPVPGRFVVTIEGELASPIQDSQMLHDSMFAAAQTQLEPVGYEQHHAFLADDNAQEIVLIGVWSDLEAFTAAANDPAFGEFFGTFFSAPPEVVLWPITDWTSI